jgi:hypothetical protein
MVNAMPGHLGGIFGKSFEHIETNIIPKILLGLNELGYTQDVDYVVGKKPHAEWDKCLYPIKKYDKTICWRNGTTFQEIGLLAKGTSNAFDFQGFTSTSYSCCGTMVRNSDCRPAKYRKVLAMARTLTTTNCPTLLGVW